MQPPAVNGNTLLLKALAQIHRRTLNSVIFGIALMISVALYIAIGSGMPSVREAFEMNELQFFSAWPLKVLLVLLVLSLATVTWTRIPFTPPRYGVWCIHAGIIILIMGMSIYYTHKQEGLARLWVDPGEGPISTEHFYDGAERALYVRVNDVVWNWYRLPSLPRFKTHQDEADFARSDLRDINPTMLARHSDGQTRQSNLAESLGLKGDVRIDITGYWPYAEIDTRFDEDPASHDVGVHWSMPGARDLPGLKSEGWLVGSDARTAAAVVGTTEIVHRHRTRAQLDAMIKAAQQIHQIVARIGDKEQALAVEPGKTYDIPNTGYSITIENFNPAWPMFGTNEIVRALTLKVKSPTMEFRRMILDGRDLQTDFKLNEEGAGPMGKRQKEPLDKNLVLVYRMEDPLRMLPGQGMTKHTLVTLSDGASMVDLVTGLSRSAEVKEFATGAGEIQISTGAGAGAMGGPFAEQADQAEQGGHAAHPAIAIQVQRKDHVKREETVRETPPARRDRNFGEMGAFQIIRARVRIGDFKQEVLVPFSTDTAEIAWTGGVVDLPDANARVQLQLGNTQRPLPARLTLKRFEVVPYPGGDPRMGSMMREFRSTLDVEDIATGAHSTEVAHLNHPIYFRNGDWLFYQASYDGQGQRWTVLGIGNRPGVGIMTLGCLMIFGGLLYAFYVKPIIIRRMKASAIAKAQQRKSTPKPLEAVESLT